MIIYHQLPNPDDFYIKSIDYDIDSQSKKVKEIKVKLLREKDIQNKRVEGSNIIFPKKYIEKIFNTNFLVIDTEEKKEQADEKTRQYINENWEKISNRFDKALKKQRKIFKKIERKFQKFQKFTQNTHRLEIHPIN